MIHPQSPWREELVEKIVSGLKKACYDTIEFCEDLSGGIKAEYLLTVNVAKEIATLNDGIGYPLKIDLEKSTREIETPNIYPYTVRQENLKLSLQP